MTNEQYIERREIMVNGSGYYDPTAYHAIKNMQEDLAMGTRKDYADGDIVIAKKHNGETEEMLLLRCHEGYATATILRDKPPIENAVMVISRQKMYMDAGRPCYVFYDTITGFVKSVSDEELERVRQKIGEALGIGTLAAQEEPKATLRDEDIMMLKGVMDQLAEKMEPILKRTKEMSDSLIIAQAERNVYRELFERERERGRANEKR